MTRSQKVIEELLKAEGGFVNRAEDRGGPTNFGITLKTLSEARGTEVTVQDVKDLTRDEAANIYKKMYIEDPKFDQLTDDNLFELVVDTGVNNGRARATAWLQRAVGTVEDGIMGPKTIAAANASPLVAYNRLSAIRMRAYGAIVSKNSSQVVFIAGWLNRLAKFIERPI